MTTLFHKMIRKCVDALRGVRFAFASDLSFRLDVLLGVILLCFGYLMRPLSEIETLFLTLSWFLVIITELQNTSIETALDRLHPQTHEEIGKSKDTAAASVLSSLVFVIVVVIFILSARI